MSDTSTPTRNFVPQQIDLTDFANLEPLYSQLVDRNINSTEDFDKWLLDFSELSAAVSEFGSRRNIEYSCHTDDPEIEKAFLHYVENIAPKIKPWGFKLQQKAVDCQFAQQMNDPKYAVLLREWREDVELFRDENVPLQTLDTTTTKEYDKLCGDMLVDYDGKQQTFQQMARYLEEPDRAVRQEAWELIEKRRAVDVEAINGVFDKLLDLRGEIAKNADHANYIDYTWKSMARFDYQPDDCHAFADAIEKSCMPVVKKLNEQRRIELGVDRLRPWDLSVDPQNRAALKPFDPDDVAQLVDKCRQVFARLSDDLATDFSQLKFGRNLDLDSRKGKRPGGYQATLSEVKQPFIFMNAAGLHRDVETLLHEAGHAFHYMWACDEPLMFLEHAPIEFCEVASMTMELLGDPHMDIFYNNADASRAVVKHLEGIIRLFPWVATIDQFQHWLYSNPGHSVEQRTEAWLEVSSRFSDDAIDWSGYEAGRASLWQRQLHLFHCPFYYVEYGIAQLGALQLWMQSRESVDTALGNYRKALKLGGTRGLPQLFEAADIRFDFSAGTLGPLVEMVYSEIEKFD